MNKIVYAALIAGLTATAASAQAPTQPVAITPTDQGYISDIQQAFGTTGNPTPLAKEMSSLVTDWKQTYQGPWIALQTALQNFAGSCSTQSAPDGSGNQLVCTVGNYVCGTDTYTACNNALTDLNTQLKTITNGITLIENPPASSDVSQAVAAAEGMQIIYTALGQGVTDESTITTNAQKSMMRSKAGKAPAKR